MKERYEINNENTGSIRSFLHFLIQLRNEI